MKKLYCIFLFYVFLFAAMAQVTTLPAVIPVGYTGEIQIIFNPAEGNGGMIDATQCYAHTGVGTTDGIDWQCASEWRSNLEKYKMTFENGRWVLFIPNMYSYYNCSAVSDKEISRLCFVFNDGPDGNKEGKTADGKDIFVPIGNPVNVYTGTLPVFYLNTDNGQEINSKENYVPASLYIDALDLPGYTSVGSAEMPIATEARGRGNYTWIGFEKKPFRLRMATKTSLLNMTMDKSYNLLAHADDNTFLRNEVGFELSRMLGLAYTPTQTPVELIKNNTYRGLYFLTDHIKVSSKRVNITEQADEATDPVEITGGWLVEIDNYEDDNQIFTVHVPYFTIKSPDLISWQQEEYIRAYLQKVEDAIYTTDKSSTEWEKYIDMTALVKFYIIQEIVGNTEAFHGSCYFSKDRDAGSETKILFGPVWDFGNAFRHGHKFIYEDSQFKSRWLPEIVQFPRFQNNVRTVWNSFKSDLESIYDYIDSFSNGIKKGVAADKKRWPQYGSGNYAGEVNSVKNYISDRATWLNRQWIPLSDTNAVAGKNEVSVYPNPTQGDIHVQSFEAIRSIRLYSTSGVLLHTFAQPGEKLTLDVPDGMYVMQIETSAGIDSRIIVVRR